MVPPGVTTIAAVLPANVAVSAASCGGAKNSLSGERQSDFGGKPVFLRLRQRFDHCVNKRRSAAGERRDRVDLFLVDFDNDADRAEKFSRESHVLFRLSRAARNSSRCRGELRTACSSSRA